MLWTLIIFGAYNNFKGCHIIDCLTEGERSRHQLLFFDWYMNP